MDTQKGLAPVSYANVGNISHAFQRWRSCSLPVSEVVARLRPAIEAAGFWNLQEIDTQVLLNRGGYAIEPARQLLFFHPRFVVRLLAADPAALLEVPLKFAILGLPGGMVTVRWVDPIASFARYENSALEDLGHELSEACERIVAESLGPELPARADS